MNRYYCSYNLEKINKYIIDNEIIIYIKNRNLATLESNKFCILTKTHSQIDLLKRELLKKNTVLDMSYLSTIREFNNKVLKAEIIQTKTQYPKDISFINEANKNVLIKESIEDLKNDLPFRYLKKILNLNTFQRELLNLIKRIKEEAIVKRKHPLIIDIIDNFRKCKRSILEEYPALGDKYNTISKILERYIEKQKEHSLLDKEDISYVASNILKEQNNISFAQNIKRIYLFSIHSLSNREIELLKTLSSLGIEIVITLYFDKTRAKLFYKGEQLIQRLKEIGIKEARLDTKNDLNLTQIDKIKTSVFIENKASTLKEEEEETPFYLIKGRNVKDEIALVGKHIKNILKNANYNIAIVNRKRDDYQDDISSIIEEYNIPIIDHFSKQLIRSKLIQTILSIMELRLNNFPQDIMLSFIKSGYTYLNSELIDGLEKGYNTNRIVKDIIYYYGNASQDIFKHFEMLSEETSKEGKHKKDNSIKLALTYLNKIKEIICFLPCGVNDKLPIHEIIKILKKQITGSFSILWNTYKNADLKLTKEDSIALKSFLDLLDELKYIYTKKQKNHAISLNHFYTFLRESIINTSFAYTKTTEKGIHYVSTHDLPFITFDYVFVIGMTEGNFPLKLRESSLFSNFEKRLINKTVNQIFPSAEEHSRDEDFVFFSIINAAKKNVFFSYPSRNNNLRENLASFYLDKIITRIPPIKNEIYSLQELYEHYGKIALNKNIDFDDSIIEKEIKELIYAKAQAEQKRDDPMCFSEYDGMILRGKRGFSIIKKKLNCSISASHMERYGQCPHRYFFYDILGIRGKKDEETLTSANKGSLIHTILYTFYKKNKDPKINDYLDKESKLRDEIKNDIKIITEYCLEKMITERKLNILSYTKKEVNSLIDAISSFIRKDIMHNNDYRRYELEYSFGENIENKDTLSINYKELNINISGKIDRIDIAKNGKTFRIIDYKSSKTKETLEVLQKKIKKGLYFQPSVYSSAGLRLLGNYTLDNFAYYYILSPNKNKLSKNTFNPLDKVAESSTTTYTERSLSYIKRYLDLIDNGNFPVNPRECQDYCEFRSACRVNLALSAEKEKNTKFWQSILEESLE